MKITDAYIGAADGTPILAKGVYLGEQLAYEAVYCLFSTGSGEGYKRGAINGDAEQVISSNPQGMLVCHGPGGYAVFCKSTAKMYFSENLHEFEEVTDCTFSSRKIYFLSHIGGVYLMSAGDEIYLSKNGRNWVWGTITTRQEASATVTNITNRHCIGAVKTFYGNGEEREDVKLLIRVSTAVEKTSGNTATTTANDDMRIEYSMFYTYTATKTPQDALEEIIYGIIAFPDVFAAHEEITGILNTDASYKAVQAGDAWILSKMYPNRGYGAYIFKRDNRYDRLADNAGIVYCVYTPADGAVSDGTYIYGLAEESSGQTTLIRSSLNESRLEDVTFEDGDSDRMRMVGGVSFDGEKICVYVREYLNYPSSTLKNCDLYYVADGALRYMTTLLANHEGDVSEIPTLYCRKF